MSSSALCSKLGRTAIVAMVLQFGAWFDAPAMAQRPAPTVKNGESVELEPLKCWWRTSKNAVHVSERFTLALTCALVDTSRITVVPDLSSLEPTTLQIAPFEVMSGTPHQDIRAAPLRYLQREYTVRLIGETFFWQDVEIPSVKVPYRIQSPTEGGTEGRDQTYVLPALPMRVLSLVPKKATDIQDATNETFGDIEARRVRGTEELVASAIFFGFALVLVGLAAVRVAGRYRSRTPVAMRPLPARSVLRGCLQGIGGLRTEVARDGWTPERVSRALTAFRIAGAVALGRPVARTADAQAAAREGELVLRTGILRRKRVLISAPTTSAAIALHLTSRGSTTGPTEAPGGPHEAALAKIREVLRVFDAARYSRDGRLDQSALDAGLDDGARAVERLRFTKLWLTRTASGAASARGPVEAGHYPSPATDDRHNRTSTSPDYS